MPTGNFGDILAGYYAKQMGLPVGKLICASNENNVLTDFLTTGTYTAKREFFKTTSPSMDILVSSNLERLLYHVTGSDTEVAALMKSLPRPAATPSAPKRSGPFRRASRAAGAVRNRWQGGDPRPLRKGLATSVIPIRRWLSMLPLRTNGTACRWWCFPPPRPSSSPRSVLEALGHTAPQNDFEAMQELEAVTHHDAPASLAALRQKAERFSTVIDPARIAQVALSYES